MNRGRCMYRITAHKNKLHKHFIASIKIGMIQFTAEKSAHQPLDLIHVQRPHKYVNISQQIPLNRSETAEIAVNITEDKCNRSNRSKNGVYKYLDV